MLVFIKHGPVCIMANHLHFGLICPKVIVRSVFCFFRCSFTDLSPANMFFAHKQVFPVPALANKPYLFITFQLDCDKLSNKR